MKKKINIISLAETIDTIAYIRTKESTSKLVFDRLTELELRLRISYERQVKNVGKWCPASVCIGFILGAATALFAFPQNLHADSLVVNLTSIHADKTYKYNSANTGFGLLMDVNRHVEIEAGFYNNSYGKTSLYTLINLKHEMNGWNWGIAGGLVTGYNDIEDKTQMQSRFSNGRKNGSLRPHHNPKLNKSASKYKVKDAPHSHPKNVNAIQFMVLPNVTWKITKEHALNLIVVPAFSKNTFAFAGLKYRYKFD